MSSRTQPVSRHSLSLLKSLKSLCSSSSTLSRRVQGEDFTEVPDDETTLTFLINLGYKGLLHKHPSMYVDHMHQLWRTLAAIINKCLSGKTASNDRPRISRIDILWGMFYKENVDYPELIWEDFAFQIDHMMEKQRRRENMPYPRILSNVHKYSTVLIPPKESRGKGLQGKKAVVSPKPTSDEESDKSNAKPARKPTGSRRVIKKKVSISVDDNIIPEPNVALELGKSMSLTEVAEEEATLLMKGLDTSGVSNKTSHDPSQKLKGVQTLTLEEQIGSEEESEYTKEDDDDENIECVDTDEEEEKNDDDDEKSINLEKTNDEEIDDEFVHSEEHVQDDDEETDDEFVHGDKQVNDDEVEEMTNVEDADTGNDDEEIIDMVKADAEKTEEVM
ncbi:hypothetical protein Tco_1302267 [Tanacetum coccineum]